ncbi:MAG: type II toxin-antitoxin system VapC family toxin [Acidobacteriota bacterium]|nr:type II toxin-antitoxin system VapC family toxin [Acidobacteriota bacterium]
MPASGKAAEALLDTSVAVAVAVADHDHHVATLEELGGMRLGLAGHAAFETFSVLTRLPPPARRTPRAVSRLLAASFPSSRFLGEGAARSLMRELSELGIAGGAVYDALVGAVAREHGMTLFSRDRRAAETYRALEVRVELIS